MKKKTVIKDEQPRCAKCGACTSVCPVYKITGRESLSARGKIHLLSKQDNLQKASGLLPELFSKCLLCGACAAACPRGINVCELVQQAREEMPEISGLPGVKKSLCRQILAHPKLLHILGKSAQSIAALDKILPPASGLRLRLGLPPISDGRQQSAAYSHQNQNNQSPQVLYFSGCLATYLAQDIQESSTKLLKSLCQMPTLTPKGQNCCGMAALASGNTDQAKELAIKNIKLFSQPQYNHLPIFTSCATCYSQLKSYRKLLANDRDWAAEAAKFSSRVWEFSEFLLQYGKNIRQCFSQKKSTGKIFYHDPCHLRFRANKDDEPIITPPRQLLKNIPGLQLIELPHGSQCCGQGGLFNIAHSDLSSKIGNDIRLDFYKSKAKTVTTTCTGCLNQWQRLLADNNDEYNVIHLAVLLADMLSDR